jgi:hypothetical protein
MLELVLIFRTVSALLSSGACPSYNCGVLNGTSIDSVCISSSSTSYTVSKCSNSSLYCEVPGPSQPGTCQLNYQQTYLSYPGEGCTVNANCTSNSCLNNVCQGASYQSACISDQDCNRGLNCRKGACSSQLSIGQYGCSNDYDCVNNAGCSTVNSQFSGTCIQYYSLSNYYSINYCYGNKNKLCESGVCGTYNGTYLCLPELENSLYSPYACNTSDYCYSVPDPLTGISLKGKCECGLSGNSYCTLFPGDPETLDYKVHRNAWVNTNAIQLCHTSRRFSTQCINQQWDSKKYSYWYYEDYVNLYPYVYNAPSCTIQVYYPDYYSNILNFQISDSQKLMILGLLLLVN